MKTSVAQIAKKAGVSVSSAYGILSDPDSPRFQEATRKRVLEASRELDYRPHTAARAVRTGRFDCVTLLLSTAHKHSYLPNRLLYGIYDELCRKNIHLTIARLSDEMLTNEEYMPKILRYQMADGLLVDYTDYMPSQMDEIIQRFELPVVWVNAKRDCCCVYPDSFSAGVQATEYLLKMGHRRIAFVDYQTSPDDVTGIHFSKIDRCKGYESAMQQAGLQTRIIRPKSAIKQYMEEMAYIRDWIQKPDRPTAIVTYWVASALPVLQCAWSCGLRVPQELSIITFNSELFGSDILRESGLCITSMVEPDFDMGLSAAQMMIKKIEKPLVEIPARKLEFTLEDFGTCCTPDKK